MILVRSLDEEKYVAVLWLFEQGELSDIKKHMGKTPSREDLITLVEDILERYGNMEYYDLEVLD
jgi:hypothetical protein